MMYAKEMELRWIHSRIQIANSGFQVFFDLAILALPIPVILKIRLRRKDRGKTCSLVLNIFDVELITLSYSRINIHISTVPLQLGCDSCSPGIRCQIRPGNQRCE